MIAQKLSRYVAKLERRERLPDKERSALLDLPTIYRDFQPHQEIVVEGENSTHCMMVEAGLVSCSKTMRDGSRQITAFGLPGDLVDLDGVLLTVAGYGVKSHGTTSILSVSHKDILAVAAVYPAIARALWLDTLVDAAILRAWVANVGQRKALGRITHLLLELASRFDKVEPSHHGTYRLPVTQLDLGEALGMSVVHVNRSLQWLRKEGHLSTLGRSIQIYHYAEMQKLSGFDDFYLHGGRRKDFPSMAA